MIREYTRNIESISASLYESKAAAQSLANVSLVRDGKNRWIASYSRAQADGWLKVEYTLYCRENSVRTNWLDSDYGFLTGAATFPWAEGHEKDPIAIELFLPKAWRHVATSLKLIQQTSNCFVYQASSFDDLVDSPIVCGNLESRSFEVSKRKHHLVNVNADGRWDLDRATQDVATIVAKQHEFWQEVPYDEYSFLNLCTETGGGLEHDNSTVLMCSRFAMLTRASYVDWLSLVSHEFFHTWNVRRLRPRTLMRYDYESEQFFEELWIAEGITSYFDDLFVVRAGLCSVDEYLTRLSNSIQTVQCSLGRLTQNLSDSSWDTWVKLYRPDENSPNARISYYRKGCLLAWLLDSRLRNQTYNSISLDNVVRELWKNYRDSGYTHQDFADIVEEFGSKQIRQWLDHELKSTDELDFGPALENFGLQFRHWTDEELTQLDPKLWLGCETQATESKLFVRRVLRQTAAAQAGLNVDDELLAIAGYRITPESWTLRANELKPGQPVELLVSRRGKVRSLTIESGPKPAHNWQLALDPMASKDKIGKWLG